MNITLKYFCTTLIALLAATVVQAQAGFKEEMLPDIFKVHGKVKMMEGIDYRPDTFADTMGKGIAESRGVLYYDTLGHLVKKVGNEVKYRTTGDLVEYFTWFGKDSMIKSVRKGDIRSANTFVTVNRYDDQGRLAQQEFYRNKPRKLSALVINTYDNNGFLVKQLHKGEEVQDDVVTNYLNDSRGNHLEILPPRVNALHSETKRSFSYDEHNNVTLIEDQTNPKPYRAFCYQYDDHGNWIKQTEYNDPKCHASRVIFRHINYY